jgi:hypothetical protein
MTRSWVRLRLRVEVLVRKRISITMVVRLLTAAIVLTSYLCSLYAAQLNPADPKSSDAFREQVAAIGRFSRANDTTTVRYASWSV